MRRNIKRIKNRKKRPRRIIPPFGYFGSKHRIAMSLCKRLPPHNAWVEAFCGSASITLAKKPAPIEIINDIDEEIVNLFKQLRDNPAPLCRLAALTPYSRSELAIARKKTNRLSRLERARRFLVSAMMSINGVFGPERGGFSFSDSYSRNGREARVNRWYNLPDRLSSVVERLRSVRIDNRNALTLIREYVDRPATLMYLDPPYLADRTNGYTHDANSVKFHKKMLKLVANASCMIFISGYENEMYDRMLNTKLGWTSKKIQTTTRDSSGKTHERTEVVWMNRQFCNALKSKQMQVTLTSKEEKNKKINPLRRKPK